MSELIYTSLKDFPLDEWNGYDFEDQPYPVEIYSELRSERVEADAAKARYVPFVRPIKLGTRGGDVYALKRALATAGYGQWGKWGKFKRHMGLMRVNLLKQFQKNNDLAVTGVYNEATHKKLARFYDTYGAWLLSQTSIKLAKDAKRRRIVATAMHGYHNRQGILYTQTALRMQGVRHKIVPPGYPRWEDCSSFATWCYWVAGAPDPNGLGYNGQGWTGTQVANGRRVSLSAARVGDLVFYGWQGFAPSHVAVYVGENRVVSHGSHIGPLFLPVNYRTIGYIHTYF